MRVYTVGPVIFTPFKAMEPSEKREEGKFYRGRKLGMLRNGYHVCKSKDSNSA